MAKEVCGGSQATHDITELVQDVLAYIEWLRIRDGRPYRLPNWAEWRLAMQGATAGVISLGRYRRPWVVL